MIETLTERQKAVVEYIAAYREANDISPSIREICAYFGLKSPAGVHKILAKLIDKNIIEYTPGKNRSLRLARGYAKGSIPLVGRIAAGQPEAALPDREDLRIDPTLFGSSDCFALLIQGDSMIGEHIMEGDIAILKPCRYIENGRIGAVMIENILPEATLKRVYRRQNSIELHSADSRYEPLVFTGEKCAAVKIVGEYIGLIRRRG